MDQTQNNHEHSALNRVRRNQIIIVIVALIVGFIVAIAVSAHRRPFLMRGDYRNGGMMERKQMMRGGDRMMAPQGQVQGDTPTPTVQ